MMSMTLAAVRTAAADPRAPIARERGEAQQNNRARGHERKAVIDDVERGPKARQQAKQGQACAYEQTRDNQSFQPTPHLQSRSG